MTDRPLGDAVDQEYRRLMSDIATVPGPAPELDELHSPVLTFEERTMTSGAKYGLIGAVAAALAIIVGLVFFLADGDDGGLETIDEPESTTTTTATTTTTTEAPATTDPSTTTAAEAASTGDGGDGGDDLTATDRRLSQAEGYFATFNAGDFDALPGFLAEGVDEVTFLGPSGEPTPQPVDTFWTGVAFGLARGDEYLELDCADIADDGETTTVECEQSYMSAIERAVGGTAANSVATLEVADEGVTSFIFITDPSTATDSSALWFSWIGAHYTDELGTLLAPDVDVESATRRGERWREVIDEWEEHNERYGCTTENFRTCGPLLLAQSFLLDRVSGNAGDAVARFAPDASVDGLVAAPSGVEALVAFENAIGASLSSFQCSVETPLANEVTCNMSSATAWSEALGVEREPSQIDFVVNDDSLITDLVRRPDSPEYTALVWDIFVEWLSANHPDDVANMIDAEGRPIATPDAIELWATYTDEFVDAQG